MFLKCQDNDNDTVLGKVLAVTENDISDIADTESVNENAAGQIGRASCRERVSVDV